MSTIESLNIFNIAQSGREIIQTQVESFLQSEHYPFIIFLCSNVIVVLVALFLLRILIRIKLSLFEKALLLEIVPPTNTEKTSYTTQQLFSVIYNLGKQQTLWEKLLGKKITFSCEIASTHSDGIRYLLRTSPKYVNNLKRSLFAYLPEVRVAIVDEYIPSEMKNFKVVEFVQSNPFAYSLKKQNMLDEHDPVAYITGMMTKLSSDEQSLFNSSFHLVGQKQYQCLRKKS